MGFRVTEYVGFNQIAGSRRVAYEFGPSLLVARPAPGSWNNASDCVHVRGANASAPGSWLQALGDEPPLSMRFAPARASADQPVQYVPYFEVNDEQMTAFAAFDLE
jgi:hypothetical protein